jgi:hypothetical protein
LEVEDWIRTLEQKFSLIQCNNIQKTQCAVQQLQSSTGAWWVNFIASRPEGQHFTYDDFCTAFLTRFIPDGIRRVKIEQFYKLKQEEDQDVMKFLEKFNQLCQYDGEHVWDDEEKKLSRNRPNYNSTSTKTINEVIKFSHLSPYNSGSPMKSRGISNQPTYKPRS